MPRIPTGLFAVRLTAIVVAGVGLRVLHALIVAPHTGGFNDAFWFSTVGSDIAQGHGFVEPVGSVFAPGFHRAATALHPPLYPLWLAGLFKLGVSTDLAQRALGALFGAATTCLVGLLGRRIGGDRLGLLAAGLAAVHPVLIAADGTLLSEGLYGTVCALVLLVAWRFGERPSFGRAALLGAAVALAALTRSEGLLLLLVLVVPLVWGARPAPRWRLFAVSIACTAVVLSPWVIRNWSVYGRPLLSTNDGTVVAGANCHRAYHGRDLGYWVLACEGRAHGNEAQGEDQRVSRGLRYARDHAGRLPVVMAVRVMRAWTLYQPFRGDEEQGRSATVERVGIVLDYVLALLSLAGALALRRMGRPLRVLLAPIWLVTLAAVLGYGFVRLREPAELSLVVLGAVGALALLDRWRGRSAVTDW